VSESLIVADAGPLIGLARISRLELLRSLFTATLLPPAVYAECVSASGKPGAAAIAQAVDDRWLTVRAPSKPAPRDLPTGIGPGEREAIALAVELACPVLMDDKLARAAAQASGLSVIGTGGLLLAAKSRSLITSVGPALEQLHGAGYHLSEELIAKILELAREKRSASGGPASERRESGSG
jgi:predicted nucleic acid-binding protein